MNVKGYSGDFVQRKSDQAPKTPSTVIFEASPGLDPTIKATLQKFLSAGSYYSIIKHYVDECSKHKFGLVHHALAGSLRSLLEDYLLFVAQLESKLSQPVNESVFPGLGSLWTWSQPTIVRMKLLAELVSVLVAGGDELRGGKVLTVLYEFWTRSAGDPKAKALYGHLLNASSKPYLQLLIDWVSTGALEDPYEEFFILQRSSKPPSAGMVDWWWDNVFVLRGSEVSKKPEMIFKNANKTAEELAKEKMQWVPSFLTDMAQKVLDAGKCWHVLIACGKIPQDLEENKKLDYSVKDISQIGLLVETAHRRANKEVLKVIFQDFEMLPKLRIMKQYFFMSQSDYLLMFLDSALPVLRQPANQLSAVKLQHLLDLAVKSSSDLSSVGLHRGLISSHPSSDDGIKVELSRYAFVDMLVKIISVNAGKDGSLTISDLETSPRSASANTRMTGLQTFTLDTDIPFPLSVMISRKSITKYQLIFRQLFLLKSVERLLGNAWIDHQMSARTFYSWSLTDRDAVPQEDKDRLKGYLQMAWLMRAKMCSYIQGLLSFVTDRLESQSHGFFEYLLSSRHAVINDLDDEIKSIDELVQKHDTFLDTCLKECLITNKKLVLIQHQLFSTCTSFAQQTERFLKSFKMDPSIVFTSATGGEISRSPLDVYSSVVFKCHDQFEESIKAFKLSLDVLAEVEGEAWVGDIHARLGL